MVSPTTPLERLWMMGRWGKRGKNKLFPGKLLIKNYIPKDSGQKKHIQGGKKDFYLTMYKKNLLKSNPPPPPPNTFLMAIPYAKSDSAW